MQSNYKRLIPASNSRDSAARARSSERQARAYAGLVGSLMREAAAHRPALQGRAPGPILPGSRPAPLGADATCP